MNAILRLYPPAWRGRYLGEVAELLAERPPSARDQLDLVRGALDAWLHPQVTTPATGRDDEPIVRQGAVVGLGVLAGLMWAIGGIAQHTGGFDPISGYKASGGTMLVIAAAFVAGIAALARAWSGAPTSRALRGTAVGMLLFALLALGPWPILVIGYWGHLIGTMLFGLRIHESGQRVGTVLVVAALAAFTFNTETAWALATVPLGVVWIALGLGSARRRQVASGPAPA